MRLTQMIEALLFASDAPLSAADLLRIDEQLDEDTVEAVIQELRAEYELGERSFQVYEVAGGYQLLTRPEFVTVLERYDSVPQPARLSVAALEVLAIIAYRQPIGRAEIEDIRGVGSSGVLRTLQERELVDAVARGEGLGRPLLYGTTQKFLEHFGFRSLEDLPRPDELPVVLRERMAPPPSPVGPEAAVEPEPIAAPAPVTTAAGEAEPPQTGPKLATDSDVEAADTGADATVAALEPQPAAGGLQQPATPEERSKPAAQRDGVPEIDRQLPLAAAPSGTRPPDARTAAHDAEHGGEADDERADPTAGDEPEFSEVGGHAPGT